MAAAGSGSRASAPSRSAASSPSVASPSAVPMYVQRTVGRCLPIDRDPGKGAGIDVRPVGQQRASSRTRAARPPGSARAGQPRASVLVARDELFRRAGLVDAASLGLEDGPPGGLPAGFVAHAGARPRLRALEAPKFSPTMGARHNVHHARSLDQPGPRTTCALRSGSER